MQEHSGTCRLKGSGGAEGRNARLARVSCSSHTTFSTEYEREYEVVTRMYKH